ncbi:hypothetical protein [Pedobacter paludis]|nr:hypothetical protein [Pedobacter paludis]
MYEAFFELLDQLYWKGYAEGLLEQNPTIFRFHFHEFLNDYQN